MGRVGIVVGERTFAVGVGRTQAIELGKRDSLDDGEAALGAIAQVALGIFARLAMEQLPGRIAEPEERLAVSGHEEALVLGHLQPGERLRGQPFCQAQRDRQPRHARNHP